MENQHRKITGYRELNQAEIDLVNEIKAQAANVGSLVDKMRILTAKEPFPEGLDPRCLAHARTQLQDGFMWLTRAVTKPESF